MKNGKIVLITGATSGIGKMLARYFTKNADIVILLGRDVQKLEKVNREFKGSAERFLLNVDLSYPKQVGDKIGTMLAEDLYPNLVIHSAAEFGPTRLSVRTTAAERRRTMQVNYLSPSIINNMLVQAYFNKIIYGRIIHIGSLAGVNGQGLSSSYCESKHALAGYVKTLDKEFINEHKFKNVRCFYPAPGPIDGSHFHKFVLERMNTQKISRAEARQKIIEEIGQLLKPKVVVDKIIELCSADYSPEDPIVTFY